MRTLSVTPLFGEKKIKIMITSKIRKAAQLWAFSMRPFRPPALLITITILILFPSPESSAQVIGRPPVITNQPISQIVAAGTNVTFSVGVAPSSTPLSYQWQTRADTQSAGAIIAGANSATLVLTNVQLTAGRPYYSVNVANAAGSVTSADASLTVFQVSDQTVSLGANVTFKANSISSGVGATFLGDYQWQFNGFSIGGATNRSLAITNVQLANAGVYSLSVTNEVGAATASARLDVDPTFTKITTGPIVNEGTFAEACSWGDFDGDGRIDLFVARSGGVASGGPDLMYKNLGGGQFGKVRNAVTLAGAGVSIANVWADYDNNGTLDLFVGGCCGQEDKLFRNDGDGQFTRVPSASLTPDGATTRGAAWADYDLDGHVDLFIANQGRFASFYHNNGDGTFLQITDSPLVNDITTRNIGCSWADYDGDGYPDLFVSHWRPDLNRLYHNNGNGTFTRVTSGPVVTDDGNSSGGSWGDYDNDGHPDLFVANFNGVKSALYHNNGDGTFTRVPEDPLAPALGDSWSGVWGDYDNDGLLDLFVARTIAPNLLYHNNGDGTFTRILSGSLVNDGGTSTGSAWGDYNDDGFLDLAVVNWSANSGTFLYLNNGNSNQWVTFKLVGQISNRSAIGAKVRVKTLGSAVGPVFGVRQLDAALDSGVRLLDAASDPKRGQARALQSAESAAMWQLREISGGTGYASQNDLRAHFGLGDAAIIDTVRIEWPSGIVQEMHNVTPKQFLTVTESGVAIFPRVADMVVGSNHVFTAKATFAGLLKYQWRFNGADLPGENNPTLRVQSAGASSAGEYSVVVRDAAGGELATSSSALLRWTDAPEIRTQPQSQIAVAGTDVRLSVQVVPSATALSFQWFKDGSPLPALSLPTLVLTNAQLIDGGSYTVVVSNAFFAVTSAVADVTIIRDTSISGSLGARVTLRIASGGPPLSYQWRLNGENIAGTTQNTYVITNAQPSNVGQYSVVVANGSVTLTNFLPALVVDPTFTKITTGPVVNDGLGTRGGSWADYDNDGDLDLFVAAASGASGVNNLLYQNKGDGSFSKATPAMVGSVVGDTTVSGNGSWGDYDNDGFLDLFVGTGIINFSFSSFYSDLLYHNNGNGTFTRMTTNEVGVIVADISTAAGAAWADYDNDGLLDLFVATLQTPPNLLYHNTGNGTFTKLTNGPVVTDLGLGLGCAWADYDNDGHPDLFVANLTNTLTSFLYHNNGNGTFTRINEGPIANDRRATGGGAWGDFDNDGDLDLFVANYGGSFADRNFLYRNNGDGTFTKLTNGPAVSEGGFARSASWGDYDNDGFLDLFVANSGYTGEAGMAAVVAFPTNNFLYHNNGDGTFAKIISGSIATDVGNSRSSAWGDYDNDGFLDLFVANTSNPNDYLYRNNGNGNSWIKIRCVGTLSNRSGIGAKVRVKTLGSAGGPVFGVRQLDAALDSGERLLDAASDPKRGQARALQSGEPAVMWQLREITTGDGYQNSPPPEADFGLGNATNIDTVRIEWPSGIVQELRNVATNQFLTVTEPPRLSGLTRKADGAAQLSLIGASGLSARVEVSTNLVNWTPLVTVTNRARIETFIDPAAKNVPQRFYRAVGP